MTRLITPRGSGKSSVAIPWRKKSVNSGAREDRTKRTWLDGRGSGSSYRKSVWRWWIDQLEELFTTGFSLEVRQKYVSALDDLVRSGRVFVLATLRSDFYASYQEFPDVAPVASIDFCGKRARQAKHHTGVPAGGAGKA